MNASLVLTLLGADRPGIVDALSSTLTAHGANWLDSRMARLAGKFAGILHLEVAPERAAALTAALEGLRSQGLTVVVERSDAAATPETRRRCRLELTGSDRPGIVREISHALADLGVNVDDLETGLGSAPMSGEPLFSATAELHLPDGLPLAKVRAALESIARDLMVDVALD